MSSPTHSMSRDDLFDLVSDLLLDKSDVENGGPTYVRGDQRSLLLHSEPGNGTIANLRRSTQMVAQAAGMSFQDQAQNNGRVAFGSRACTFATMPLHDAPAVGSDEFFAGKVNQVIDQMRSHSRPDGMTVLVLDGVAHLSAEAAQKIAKHVAKIQGEGTPFLALAVSSVIPGQPEPEGTKAFAEVLQSVRLVQQDPEPSLGDSIRARRTLTDSLGVTPVAAPNRPRV